MVEEIQWNGKILALVLRSGYEEKGVNFITPPENPLQLGVLIHQQGTKIKPHIHKNIQKTINEIQEVLHIEYGKVEVEFYQSEGRKVATTILNSCDTILLLSGGHGFNILEDSKIVEVKQGPYHGRDEDKALL